MNQSFNICRHFVVSIEIPKSLNALYSNDKFGTLAHFFSPYSLSLCLIPFYKVCSSKGFAVKLPKHEFVSISIFCLIMTFLNMIALILPRNKLNLEANHLGTCYETKPVATLIFYFNSFDQLFIII